MPKYRNYSALDRANEERAQIHREFKEGYSIREVCRLLGKTMTSVRRDMKNGQLLALRMYGLTDGFGEQPLKRRQSRYRFPKWQFDKLASRYLPIFLLLLFARFSLQRRPSVEAIYDTARNYLMYPNRQFGDRSLIQILCGKNERKIKKALELVYPDFFKNRKQNPRKP